MAYIAHVVTGVWWSNVGICNARVCTVFVSSRSGIVFNPSAGSITDHSQSAKETDPYFKSQLYVEEFYVSCWCCNVNTFHAGAVM